MHAPKKTKIKKIERCPQCGSLFEIKLILIPVCLKCQKINKNP
jgi:uncharacterized protein (DUF983 family)